MRIVPYSTGRWDVTGFWMKTLRDRPEAGDGRGLGRVLMLHRRDILMCWNPDSLTTAMLHKYKYHENHPSSREKSPSLTQPTASIRHNQFTHQHNESILLILCHYPFRLLTITHKLYNKTSPKMQSSIIAIFLLSSLTGALPDQQASASKRVSHHLPLLNLPFEILNED